MPPRRDLLPALTPLRFPAALIVFLAHAWGVLKGKNGAEWAPWTIHASIGVSFFFVMSGFILTYNYLEELRKPTFRSVWNFYVARWARTYPVHFLTLFLLLPVIYTAFKSGKYGNPRSTALAHVFLGHAFLPEDTLKANSLNPPSWSLSAEWFLYLCLPLLIPGLATGSLRRRAAVFLLALSPWLVALAGTAGLFPLPKLFSPYRYPPVRLLDFVAGVLLGLAWRNRYGGIVPQTTSFRRASVIELGAVCLLCGWLWAIARATPDLESAKVARWVGVYLPPCLLLIWVLARGGGLVSKLLISRPMAYLGEISFAFYMVHWSVLLYFVYYAAHFRGHSWAYGWKWGLCAGVAFVLAVACYHLYEIPLRDRLRKKLSIRRPATPPVEKPAENPPTTLPFPAPTAGERAA
jgi:peptidoglycan/LPS O-acetylase OafA/YrhL